jgi:hypothetical protein
MTPLHFRYSLKREAHTGCGGALVDFRRNGAEGGI